MSTNNCCLQACKHSDGFHRCLGFVKMIETTTAVSPVYEQMVLYGQSIPQRQSTSRVFGIAIILSLV